MPTAEDIIREFFEGAEYELPRSTEEIGFIWVARHDGYDTLTFEPRTGGQYEVAVRIKVGEEYQGYFMRNPNELSTIEEKSFNGVNTRGH